LSGNSGQSTAPHLHFEVRRNGTPIDPYEYVKQP
jgi:murein DD-endopeptidase MepM/ murein hydrolase activator NlpD